MLPKEHLDELSIWYTASKRKIFTLNKWEDKFRKYVEIKTINIAM